MNTGLEYEGEAVRKRFVVYWLRPAIAALGFGLFTFLVTAVPGEKEKIELRSEIQRLRAERETLDRTMSDLRPRVTVTGAPGLTVVNLGNPGDPQGWGRVLYDDGNGHGAAMVHNIDAEGQRVFYWWRNLDGTRRPLAALDLERGSGHALIRFGDERTGSFLVTLESLEGEPSQESQPILEAAISRP